MKRKTVALAFVTGLATGGQPALADWQCLSAGAKVPAAAQAASNYLERAERVYPTQLLGLMRAGERVYLVNARDDGWSERVRQGLMELRLPEPDITAARRFQGTLSGGPTPDASGIPVGEFVCLERVRAGRQGLAFRGEAVLLGAWKSVHLVDPMELGIVVEVKAVGDQPLDLREIFAASARAGIYAGLFRGRAQSGPVVAVRPPESAVTFPVGPIERPDVEVVIMARAAVGDRLNDAVAADVRAVPASATVPVASVPPVAEQPPTRVAKAEVLAAPTAQPLPPIAAAPVAAETAAPVIIAARVSAPAAQTPGRVAEQSYEDYARTMKSLMELRRSGAVRSISEMTYVHPAVEDLRARR